MKTKVLILTVIVCSLMSVSTSYAGERYTVNNIKPVNNNEQIDTFHFGFIW